MHCRACGAGNGTDRAYCGSCGQPLPVLCGNCGFLNGQEARFCGGCARPVTPLASSTPPDLGRVAEYTPPYLVNRILRSRAAMEGERKLVTVMFVDIRDSFRMISGEDAEHAQTLLDSLLRAMIEAVHRYEGTVNQVLGDGFMALFGAPIAHEDHAVRAACAALAMQEVVRDSQGRLWHGFDVDALLRIGLSSGEVVIRAIRNDLSMDYRAVGPTTHMAARMEQIAQPGTIRLTGEALRLGQGLLEVEPLGRLTIKGVDEPVDVYELKGINSQRTRFAARLMRGASPLVGRDAEMRDLQGLLTQAVGGRSTTVLLDGEPGVGKSRLWYELVRSPDAERCLVLETAPASYMRGTPFAALGHWLRQFFRIEQSDSAPAVRDRVTERLRQLDPAWAGDVPAFLSALDVPVDDGDWSSLEPAQRRQRTFSAARALLEHLCQQEPVILLCEDLQWFDGESLTFLKGLAEAPPEHRLLLALTHRLGHEQEWLARCEHVRLRVDSLTPERAEELLVRLIGAGSELAALRRLIVERTSGNPFLMEESVRSLVDASVLTGTPGAYVMQERHPKFEIPGTAEALLTARIDALDPEVKELLQMAAVIGNEIPLELFQRVAELDDGVFRERLESLREREMLLESQLFPKPVYRFRHALLQEVTHRSLLKIQRVRLHARVAEAMEGLYTDRVGEWIDRLAQHAREGELWGKAVHYHQLASVRAATRWANREAVELIERGVRLLENLPPGRARSEASIDLRLAALAPLLPLGDQERMLHLLREAEEIATSLDDQRRLGAIYSQLTAALWMSGEQERALATGERALAIAQRRGDPALRAASRFNLGMVHHALANFDEAIEIHRSLLKELSGDLERRRMGWAGYPSVACRTFLASSLVHVGEFQEARAHLEAGCRLADDLKHPYSQTLVREPLGFYYLTRGELEAALDTFQLALRIAEASEVRTMLPAIVGRLAMTLGELGRHEEAIRMTEDALSQQLQRLGGRYAHRWLLAAAAAAYAALGRFDEALAAASELERSTEASSERAHHADALRLLGDIQKRRGPAHFSEAERAYRRAIEICDARGMRPGLARCSFALGTLLRSARRPAQAEPQLRRSRELYSALGMREAAEGARKLVERL